MARSPVAALVQPNRMMQKHDSNTMIVQPIDRQSDGLLWRKRPNHLAP